MKEVVKNYKDLKVWKKAYELVLEVYKITKKFPDDEKYNLTQQIRRAAVSIPSNMAEGHGRNSRQQYLYSLSVSYGSTRELETQILLACDLGYMKEDARDKILDGLDEVSRMLYSLIRSLEK